MRRGLRGRRSRCARSWCAEMKPLATEPIRYDGMGSVIAQQGTSGPRIMIDAHMDELGGMVRRVTPNGFLTMQMLGGWLDQALVDQRWIIIGSQGAGACGDGDSRYPRGAAGRADAGVFRGTAVSGHRREERGGGGGDGGGAGRSGGAGLRRLRC